MGFVIWSSFLSSGQADDDPFGEKVKKSIVSDVTSVKSARKWIDENLLIAFEEPDLGVARKGDPSYRIFIQLEGFSPTLLKYSAPSIDRKITTIELKQLLKVDGIWKLANRKSCTVDENFDSLVHEMFELADPLRLPIPDWEPEGKLGGTCWVYEFPVPDGFIVYLRRNPLGMGPEDVLVETGVSMERYAREQHLATFVMMLCSKVGGQFDFSGAK